MLGNIEQIPNKEEVEHFVQQNIEVRKVLSGADMIEIHKLAQKYLKNGDIVSAWKILLAEI